jgi:putative ABC transport system permease protein
MLTNLLQDVRYALHGFALRPMFAVVVVLTLAVGIGVNVAVFSLFDRIMLRELNVARPHELVKLVAQQADGPVNRITNQQGPGEETFSYLMFRDLERAGEPYVELAASRMIQASLGRDGATTVGSALLVSGRFFAALGVGPEVGRVLNEPDIADGPASAVMLSYDYWQTAYSADPAVVGTSLVVGGQPLTIVGVAPRGFVGTTPGSRPDVFAPLTLEWLPRRTPLNDDRLFYYAYVFGRLKPGVTIEQAAGVLNATYRTLVADVDGPLAATRARGEFDLDAFRATTLSLQSAARGQSRTPTFARTPLAIFFAATATILLIGCVNLANLMLARGAARVGEIAVRASLGAARRRLVALLSTEALLLAGLAAVSSLPIAYGVLRGIQALEPPGLGGANGVDLDWRAVAAALATGVVATLVFALLPIAKLVATDPVLALQGGSARLFGGKNFGRFRFALATSQIALSMLLLVLAALFTHSLANVARVDLGLRTESVVTFRLEPTLNGYTGERQAQLVDAVERELGAEPGVTSVSTAAIPLISDSSWGTSVLVEGFEPADARGTVVNANRVGTAFFATVGIPLLAGRDFTEADSLDRPLVAIVNEAFAKRFGLGADPVGKRLGFDSPDSLDVEIVGLVRDAAYSGVKEEFPAQLITPRRQDSGSGFGATFYVRTERPPEALLAAIPRIVARVDANVPVIDPRTFDSQVTRNVRNDWLLLTLAGTLAVVATLLAALGLYGVLSYMVVQRTREIGLRLALGAEPAGVRRMVLEQVGWMAGIGVPAGLVAALLIGNLAASFLFGLAPTDPRAIAGAALLLAVAVFGASYCPARRASRVDPVVALRAE